MNSKIAHNTNYILKRGLVHAAVKQANLVHKSSSKASHTGNSHPNNYIFYQSPRVSKK